MALSQYQEYENLRDSLVGLKNSKITKLASLLTVYNSTIDYSKLLAHIQGTHPDLKSQSLEVIKGAIGPKRMDRLTHALDPKMDGDQRIDPSSILRKFFNSENQPTISALLSLVTQENIIDFQGFLQTCLEHEDDEIRNLSFQTIIKYESDPVLLEEAKKKISGESNMETPDSEPHFQS